METSSALELSDEPLDLRVCIGVTRLVCGNAKKSAVRRTVHSYCESILCMLQIRFQFIKKRVMAQNYQRVTVLPD